eukprot:CAMPEP_0116856964 /NCGR_PEP_ID=MMETSP0418-20121206/20247_1 /TAXON_ID=1158023 /ORGANISM="Astrosyne radiata, Strain 13vi08-1A" /LENGTH=52 /DNA_ID=CAMNT_0004490509 /DNA_START=68 /DNA_END=223 /DNA_ORIENTATION=-
MTTGAYAGGIVMYGSYFYLFFMFALGRYCRGPRKESAGSEKKQEDAPVEQDD